MASYSENQGINGAVESDYRILFENSGLGMLIAGPDGRIAEASKEALRLLRRNEQQLSATRLEDLFEERSSDSLEPQEGHPHDGPNLVGPDGEAIAVEATLVRLEGGRTGVILRNVASRVGAANGPVRLNDAAGQQADGNVEVQRIRTQLHDVESKYRSIFENAVEGIFRTATDGKLSTVNPAMVRILGYEDSEEMLSSIDDVGQLYADPARREEIVASIRRTGFVSDFEVEIYRKDGGSIWASVNVWTFRDAEGRLLGFEGTLEDITDRKRADGRLRRNMDALLAIYEASQILNSTLESEEVGSGLLKIIQRASSLTAAVISVPDENGKPRVWRAVGFENLWRKARYTPEAWEALAKVLETGTHRWFRLRNAQPSNESLVGLHMPLRARERVIGVLEVYGPEVLTDEEMVDLLVSLTSKAASALENAQLYEELAKRERQLHELVGRLLNAQEEERRRVAYEVHDGLTQMLVASYHRLQAFAKRRKPDSPSDQNMLHETLEFVRQTVEEARRVIADLRPTVLDDFGLAVAVRQQLDTLSDENWNVSYVVDVGDERLPVATETALYRVVQESLNNIRKHARSTRVDVELRRVGRTVCLRIRDWGRGFEGSESSSGGGGMGEKLGLSSMRERVALIGGELQILSKIGVGTLVAAEVPLDGTPRLESSKGG